jgi:hypothetical protein
MLEQLSGGGSKSTTQESACAGEVSGWGVNPFVRLKGIREVYYGIIH